MTLKEEFQTRNFSIYAQWLGILSMFVCLATGISSIFTAFIAGVLLFIFAAFALASAFIILFLEVPLLMRICPTSAKFDTAIRKVSNNYIRAGVYGVMSVLQWISIKVAATSLIAAAVLLLLTSLCYLMAGLKGQAFMGSKTLGGQGVAEMIV